MQWTCRLGCGNKWPAYTNIEAFRNRRRASQVHPGQDCAPEFHRQVGTREPLDPDIKEGLKYREVGISNACGFGCKIYEHRETGERVLAHNSSYGCNYNPA